jgi:Type IV secretion system pilin
MNDLTHRPVARTRRVLPRRAAPGKGLHARRPAPPRLWSGGRLVGLVATTVLVVAVSGTPAWAAGPDPATARLDTILGNATAWLVGILATLATLFLTIGGIRYVMAGGDPGEVEKAKGAFKSAGLGYALAALAPLVVSIIKGILGV